MSLSDLRSSARAAARPKATEEVVAESGTTDELAPPVQAEVGAPATQEPVGVVQSTTPAGIEIYYQAGPKRLYKIKPSGLSEGLWNYDEWREVPSVSQVLDVLEKGGLSFWGMKVGVQGCVELWKEGYFSEMPAAPPPEIAHFIDPPYAEQIVDQLSARKLTVHHVRDKAADRGTSVHKALEAFAESGVVPDPKFYPENEQGYVAGLVAFINDAHPNTLSSELMVASAEHGFAGRFDWLAGLDFAGDVVVKTYPKKKPVRAAVSGGWLIDLKTSKGVYSSYKLQTAGYEGALIECGYPAPDHKGILRVTEDGRYELVESHATFDDFLAVLKTYHVLQRLK